MRPKPCEHCGAPYHQPWDDGLVECRNNLLESIEDLKSQMETVRAELRLEQTARDLTAREASRLREALAKCARAGCPAAEADASEVAELRALRAVAEAAIAFRRFHDGERPCGAALDGALDAWRGLR